MGTGPGDDGRRQAEALADREGVARTRVPVLEPERRLEPLGVEGDRRIHEAGIDLSEDLERFEVRRDHDAGAAVEQRLDERRAERRPLGRVRAGAQLVQEDQGAGARRVEDLPRLAHERGERREVLGEALLVADHGEDLIRERHAAARRRGDVAAGVGHEDEETARLERDRLATRVRSAQDEPRSVGGDAEVDGHDLIRPGPRLPTLSDQQGMARRPKIEIAPAQHLGLRGVEALGEGGLREEEVERTEPLDELPSARARADARRRSARRARAAPRPAPPGRAG